MNALFNNEIYEKIFLFKEKIQSISNKNYIFSNQSKYVGITVYKIL